MVRCLSHFGTIIERFLCTHFARNIDRSGWAKNCHCHGRFKMGSSICMYTGVRNFNLVVAKADQPPNLIFHLSGYNIIILFFPIDLPSPIMLLAYRRRTLYKAYEDVNSGLSRGEKLGVPQYFGIYYAIGELSPHAPFII